MSVYEPYYVSKRQTNLNSKTHLIPSFSDSDFGPVAFPTEKITHINEGSDRKAESLSVQGIIKIVDLT